MEAKQLEVVMRNVLRIRPFLVSLLVCAAALSIAATPGVCKKKTALYEAIPLEQWSGGSMINAVNSFDLDDVQWLTIGVGQTRMIGGPWRACVWSWQDPEPPWWPYLQALPVLDVTRESKANSVDMFDLPDTMFIAVGYSYDSSALQKPILWSRPRSDTTWSSQQLPTLAGLEGEVLRCSGYGDWGDPHMGPIVGWSSTTESVEKAVLWTPNASGGWALRVLSHYATSRPGRAHSAFVSMESDTTICGWAESTGGDTTAVIWRKSMGAWVRTALPLLPGGTQGMALRLMGEEGDDLVGEEGDDIVGWSENSLGERCAVHWYDDGGWIIEEMTELPGKTGSVALGLQGEVPPCVSGDPNCSYTIIGKTHMGGPSVGTVWEFGGQFGEEDVYDVNNLLVGDYKPTIRGLSDVGTFATDLIGIAANGTPYNPAMYLATQSSDPQAYMLVETEVVPVLESFRTVLLLVTLLALLAVFVIFRRSRSTIAPNLGQVQ